MEGPMPGRNSIRPRPPLEPLNYGGFSLDLDYYLSHDYIDIGEAASELPPIIEWVNGWLQDLTERKIIQKQLVEQVEARAYFELKGGMFESKGYGTTKPSEEALKRAVQLDERVIEAHEKYAIV